MSVCNELWTLWTMQQLQNAYIFRDRSEGVVHGGNAGRGVKIFIWLIWDVLRPSNYVLY